MEAAKQVAARRVREPGLLDLLRHWAEEKYSLPWTHESIQCQTAFELLVRFWEDHYHKNPLEAKRREDGEVMFETGDPFIDKWERELAAGVTPDLLEGLPISAREASAKDLKARRRVKDAEAELGFSEDYSDRLAAPRIPGRE